MFVIVVLIIVPVNALVAALMPRMSDQLFGTQTPGILGGVFSIASARIIPDFDADCTQLGLIALMLAMVFLLKRNVRPAYSGALTGGLMGALCLMNPMSLMVSVPCAGFFLIFRQACLRDAMRLVAPLGLAVALVMLPWLARNYGIWGEATTRTTLGSALYISNNDCAEPSLEEELRSGCHDLYHPIASLPEARLMMRLGEPAYDHLKRAEAVAWMRSHRSRFARLTWNRFIKFWLPFPLPPAYTCYAIWVITILSIPGLIWMVFKREPAAALMLSIFVLYPPIYYMVASDVRYRIPILWLSCLAAGYFFSSLIQLWSQRRAQPAALSGPTQSSATHLPAK